MIVSLLLLISAAPPAPTPAAPRERTAAVLALDPGPAVQPLVDQAIASARDGGLRVLTPTELSVRLRGAPPDCPRAFSKNDSATDRGCFRAPDEAALANLAKEATSLEANFDSDGAVALRRKILEVFDRTPRPTPRVRELAAQAWQGIASAYFAAGNRDGAASAAREGVTHFGDSAIDPRRFSPQLQRLFSEAKAKLDRERVTTVTVRATETGTLLVDGSTVGPISEQLTVQLPVGRFRFWVQAYDGTVSLPYPVDSTGQPVSLAIDPLLDRRLTLAETPSLTCADDECPAMLAKLRSRLQVDELTGVRRRAALEPAFCVVTTGATPGWLATPPRRVPLAAMPPATVANGPLSAPAPGAPPPTWTRFRWALVAAATAVVAGGTGAAFGMRSRTSFDRSQEKSRTQLEHDTLVQRGSDSARVANTLFAVSGATAILTGGLLWAAW